MTTIKQFIPVVPPTPQKPLSQYAATVKSSNGAISLIKGQLSISTILALGAIFQGLLYLLLPSHYALCPALFLILYRIADAFLQVAGVKRNPYMENVLTTKFTSCFPDENGMAGSRDVVVFMIGARCNHPLGIFGPGYKQLGDYFDSMSLFLEDPENSKKYGLLGHEKFYKAGERPTGEEYMSVMYFETLEGLHAFAQGKEHREGWDWWNRLYKSHPHLSIYHETFVVPRNNWETIYANSPLRGLAACCVPVPVNEEVGDGKGEKEEMWMKTAMEARKGQMRSMMGRLGRGDGSENEGFDGDIYADEKFM